MKKVAVVILNYKLKDQTLKCIESVNKSSYENIQIIVVDNASKDGLGEDVKDFPDVEFIASSINTGYTGGNNLGVNKALSDGADYIFILNPDTEVEKDTISKLVKGLEKYSCGIAGPKIYFAQSKKIWYAGGVFDKANVIGLHRGVDEEDSGQYDHPMETDFVSGAAILIKKEVFKKIGLFDERYFLYYEDSDFCFRAKDKSFKIMYIPDAVVSHANAQTTGLGSPLQDYYIIRNRMLFAAKFLPFRTRFALLREALKNLGNPARRLALFDFLIGNFGKGSLKLK